MSRNNIELSSCYQSQHLNKIIIICLLFESDKRPSIIQSSISMSMSQNNIELSFWKLKL